MIGQDIKLIRKARKKTQKAIAKEVGISKTYMSKIENGRQSPSLDVLYRICDNLKSDLRIIIKL